LWQRVEPGGEGAVVEHRAADEERNALAAEDFLNLGNCFLAPSSGRKGLVGVDDVEEVVRHARALGRVRLGGADVHAAVHLRGVHRHDLHGQAGRELGGEARFAARRRPEQG
jgi:hypothetical protein